MRPDSPFNLGTDLDVYLDKCLMLPQRLPGGQGFDQDEVFKFVILRHGDSMSFDESPF